MKDLKILALLICFIIIAHITKESPTEKSPQKYIPAASSSGKPKRTDSSNTEAVNKLRIIPAVYN